MGRQEAKGTEAHGSIVGRLVILVLAAAAVALTALLLRGPAPTDQRASAARGPGIGAVRVEPAVARRETRPTLDPARFVGKAAAAHRVAREMPDVLDQLYCYCYCDKTLGHQSLLSCYTDGHAAT